MASQVQIPFEGVILQEHSAPISCPTPNFAKGSLLLNFLKITQLRVGLILNFKRPQLEWKRLVL